MVLQRYRKHSIKKGVSRKLPFISPAVGPVAGDLTEMEGNWRDLTLVLSKWEQYGFAELTKILSGYN